MKAYNNHPKPLVLLVSLLVIGLATSLTTSRVSAFSSSSSSTATCTTQSTTVLLTHGEEEDNVQGSTSTQFNAKAWKRPGQRSSKKKGCSPCPDNDDDTDDSPEKMLSMLFGQSLSTNEKDYVVKDEYVGQPTARSKKANAKRNLDRREAAFAMLGALWATTTLAFPTQEAQAVYGSDAKIEMPNVIQGLNDRATKQCLVESLGNRECLVYMDPDNKLYQGADSQKLLQKVDTSSVALTKIPQLVDEKKWSGVKGIITGPMGELLATMNQLAPLSTQQADRSAALAKQVKLQLYDISAAADVKDAARILKSTQGATDALVAFVKSL